MKSMDEHQQVRGIVREILMGESMRPQKRFVRSMKFSKLGGLSTEDILSLIEHRDAYRNLYPGYDPFHDNTHEEDYYFRSKEEAYREVNELLDFFSSLPEPIPIYRTIKVKGINDIDLNYLGDSWSYSREGAINFAKNHAGGNYLLKATTLFSNVDWKETLRLHYQFSVGYDAYDEMELRILDPSEVDSLEIEQLIRKSRVQ
jgi:hypothetical protein